jgi:hypothetical protein
LYKTRIVIASLQQRQRTPTWAFFLLLLADFVIGIILFLSVSRLVFPAALLMDMVDARGEPVRWYFDFIAQTWQWIFSPEVWLTYLSFQQADSSLLYAGMLASAWLWVYLIAVIITRGITRSSGLLNWARWFLDINEHPFRSVGLVAAGLAFITTAGIAGLARVL